MEPLLKLPVSRRKFLRAVSRAGATGVLSLPVLAAASQPVADAAVPPANRSSPGGAAGQITDLATDRPIAEAIITVIETGEKVQSDPDGRFSIYLSPGQYTVVISATGFVSTTI